MTERTSIVLEREDVVAVENAILTQEETILAHVNLAEDYQGISKAYARFTLCSPLWDAIGYGCRTARMEEAIRERAIELWSELYRQIKNKSCQARSPEHGRLLVGMRGLAELLENLSE